MVGNQSPVENGEQVHWSSFNNQGLFKTAIGVSDSHSRGTEAGFGRTMVAGGIFVRIRIGEATAGDSCVLQYYC